MTSAESCRVGSAGRVTAPRPLGRRPGLDGIRALAVVLVVGYHAWPGTFRGGELGVEVFFVLSGFLITWVVLDEFHTGGAIRLGDFYVRRAVRLLPALWVLLAAYLAAAVIAPPVPRPAMLRSTVVAAGYGTGWALALGYPVALGLGHLWSLAVEEQFYLLWPLVLVVVLRRHDTRRLPAVAALGALASVALRELLWRHGAPFARVYFGFDTRCSSLLIGCALGSALAAGWGEELLRRAGTLAGPAAAAALLLVWSVVRDVPRLPGASPDAAFALAGLASAVIILWVVASDGSGAARWLDHPVAVYVGRRSYGIYLWHYTVLVLVRAWWPGGGETATLLAVAAAVAFAHLSYRWVEQPAQAWRRRRAGSVLISGAGPPPPVGG